MGAASLTRVLVVPLRPRMNVIRTSEKTAEILGSSGTLRSACLDAKFGEVEVETSEKNLILRARISDGDAVLTKGLPILVVSKVTDEDVYLVHAL